jgi:hypothetical protein
MGLLFLWPSTCVCCESTFGSFSGNICKQLLSVIACKRIQENGASTYSQLVKPALNSASAPFSLGDAEDWDPDLTLGWSNRGIGDKKMGVLRDTLLSNTHLTGIKLAG